MPHDASTLPLDHADREETRQTGPLAQVLAVLMIGTVRVPLYRLPPLVQGLLAATVTNIAALQINKLRCRRLTCRWL